MSIFIMWKADEDVEIKKSDLMRLLDHIRIYL